MPAETSAGMIKAAGPHYLVKLWKLGKRYMHIDLLDVVKGSMTMDSTENTESCDSHPQTAKTAPVHVSRRAAVRDA